MRHDHSKLVVVGDDGLAYVELVNNGKRMAKEREGAVVHPSYIMESPRFCPLGRKNLDVESILCPVTIEMWSNGTKSCGRTSKRNNAVTHNQSNSFIPERATLSRNCHVHL